MVAQLSTVEPPLTGHTLKVPANGFTCSSQRKTCSTTDRISFAAVFLSSVRPAIASKISQFVPSRVPAEVPAFVQALAHGRFAGCDFGRGEGSDDGPVGGKVEFLEKPQCCRRRIQAVRVRKW